MFNMTVKLEAHHRTTCDDVSNNNNTTETQSSNPEDLNSNPHSSVVTASTGTNLSLDSVVQRLIDKKMGRRKQNCPQRTGITSEDGKSLRSVF